MQYIQLLLYVLQQTKVSKILPDVEIDQTVYGKHRNGRYYPGRVTNKSSQTFHHVIFEDNSWSDNLFQEDIVVSAIFLLQKIL